MLGFTALTVAVTWPLVTVIGSAARVDNADAQFSIWNVAWVARTLIVDPLHVFDANIFYPHRGTLAYSEANLGAGLLALPVYWATGNPYSAYNFILLLSFVANATAMYYLARYLTGSRPAAVVAAIGFAFCPYVFGHLPHVQLLMTAGLPLGLLAFHRLSDAPSPSPRYRARTDDGGASLLLRLLLALPDAAGRLRGALCRGLAPAAGPIDATGARSRSRRSSPSQRRCRSCCLTSRTSATPDSSVHLPMHRCTPPPGAPTLRRLPSCTGGCWRLSDDGASCCFPAS